MKSVTTRGLIAALASAGVALSATVAVIAPAAHAANKKPTAHDITCDEIFNEFSAAVDKGLAQSHAGQDFSAALATARADLDQARTLGCDWAGRTVVPDFASPRASVGGQIIGPV
jgi:hypothetical protein